MVRVDFSVSTYSSIECDQGKSWLLAAGRYGFLKGSSLLQLLLEGRTLTSNRPLKFSQLWIAEATPLSRQKHRRTRRCSPLTTQHKGTAQVNQKPQWLYCFCFYCIPNAQEDFHLSERICLQVSTEASVAINVQLFNHRPASYRTLQMCVCSCSAAWDQVRQAWHSL